MTQEHTPLPWRLESFDVLDDIKVHALNARGKSPTGRNWTAYGLAASGELVFEAYGFTPEEAEANARLILDALAEKES